MVIKCKKGSQREKALGAATHSSGQQSANSLSESGAWLQCLLMADRLFISRQSKIGNQKSPRRGKALAVVTLARHSSLITASFVP
jgi:hypothetical protein